MTKPKLSLIALAALGLALGLGSPRALAASAPTGISISPFIQTVSIGPNDTTKTFTLALTNHTQALQEIKLATKDFGSLNDTGGVILEGSTTAYTQKYGLTSWLSLEKDTVDLGPGETASLLVTIDNRSSLQPGGHYGAIVASVDSLNQASGNHVAINQALTSLILADKVGGEHYDLKLSSISQNGNWLHLPSTVKLIFQNPGNVHVVPRGIVSLKSPSGKVLARGIINDESAYILPESFRQLYVTLMPVSKSLPLPGLYHIQVDYRYDGLQHFATKSHSVHFIDLKLFLLVVILVGLIWWFWPSLKRQANRAVKKAK